MEVASGEYGEENIEKLRQGVRNGLCDKLAVIPNKPSNGSPTTMSPYSLAESNGKLPPAQDEGVHINCTDKGVLNGHTVINGNSSSGNVVGVFWGLD
jgi:hypothetical protein